MEFIENQNWDLLSSWMIPSESLYWQSNLANKVDWKRHKVYIYGKEHVIPRMSAFIAEEGISYKYSGHTLYGYGLPDWFLPLLHKVNRQCEIKYNGCLFNLYRDGNDHMGWHSDDELELDSSMVIASLSLGAERDFLFKNRFTDSRHKLTLKNGDLLLMHPNCQRNWLHSLPVRKRIKDIRFNLTFRKYRI